MGLFAGIWLILLGVLGAADIIIAKKPDAKELIGKMAPYQGWFGAVSAIWGAWLVVSAILNIGWLGSAPIWWASFLATAVLCLSLGLLFGVGVLKSFVKNPQASAKLDETVAKIMPFRGKLGIAALAVGGWTLVYSIIR